MDARETILFAPLAYAVAMSVVYWAVLWRGYVKERARRKRFPKRFFTDGELMYGIDYEGCTYPAPRWELRIERDGSITPIRKTSTE